MGTGLLVAAVLLQVLAAILALRLIRVTGTSAAWVLIAAAMLLMVMRRAVAFVLSRSDDIVGGEDPLVLEALWVAISALMLAGVAGIAPIFASFRRSTKLESASAQEKVVVLNSFLRALRDVNQLIAREKDRDQLIQGTCHCLAEARGCHHVWIVLIDSAGGVCTAAEAGLGKRFPAVAERLSARQLPDCIRRAMENDGPLVVEDATTDCADGASSGERKDRYGLALRLQHAGETYGAMLVATTDALARDAELQALLQEAAVDIAFALRGLRLEEIRVRSEADLRLERARLEALWKLNQMSDVPLRDVTDYTLEESVRLTESKIGYVAMVNDDETVLIMNSWSKSAMEECAVIDKPIVYPLETTGLWGEAVRQRKPIITNDYAEPNPWKKGYPEGHVALERHMNVPVFDDDRIVLVAGVANKEQPYDESDVRHLTLLMQGLWRLIQRRRAQEELQQAHDAMEQRVQERTAELAAANEELRHERSLLHTLMDNLPHVIYFKDKESRFTRVNRGLARYFGLAGPIEAVGKSDRDFFTEEHASEALADELKILQTGQPIIDKEEKETWPDGHTTWASTTKMPLYDDEGNISGTFGISRDVTERKLAVEALRTAKEAAESASLAKSTFLANMSHEIRTPLNAIIGMTELVLDTPLGPRQREFLTTVRDSGESLLAVINDILDLSKIEAGKFALDCSAFDLHEELGDTMKSFALRAAHAGLELVCDIDPRVPRTVVGDYHRLRQVIVNLVGNAIKFTECGEVVVAVRQSAADDEHCTLHFTVSDTGIGIPENKRCAIFEMFEQVDSTLSRRHGGTGLGLAIASRLVALMEGRLWVDSEMGRGSCFHFTVRLGLTGEPAPKAVSGEADSLHALRVLVVDDNATNRRILDEVLQSWGMEPTVAPDAQQALDLLRRAVEAGTPFRLVLTDAHMPDTDGFAMIERMRSDAQIGSPVVMMLTSGDRPEDMGRCEQLNIAAYLLKPIKQSELLDAIKLALGIVQPVPAAEPRAAATARACRPLRILLAEDSLVNQKLAVALLEGQGHTVSVAMNGKATVAMAQSQPLDLVLMDIQMPEMDGLEATACIRARERETGTHLPIIAMTAHALKGDRERCLAAGMDGYVAKPVRAGELFDTINKMFGSESHAETSAIAPAATPPTPPNDIIQWNEVLANLRGDGQLLRDVVDAALEEAPRLLRDLSEAIQAGDADRLRLAAHTLKGSLRCFGVTAAGDYAYQLELKGKQKVLSGVQDLFLALKDELDRVLEAMKTFLRTSHTLPGEAR